MQKAWLLLLVFVLTPVMGWTALGFPTDNVALGAMVTSVLAGVIGFVKVMLDEDESVKKVGVKKSKQSTTPERVKEATG